MRKITTEVGRSHRTPIKHMILDHCLGRIVGVGWNRKTLDFANFRDYPMQIIDLCAGDGVCVNGTHTSSPFLLHKHAWFAENPRGVRFVPFDTRLVLIELNAFTAAQLDRSIKTYDKQVTHELIIGDAREFTLSSEHITQPIFINADPNHVNELPIPRDFREQITQATTFTVTLGCNVGGLKRLDPELRQEWYEYVKTLCEKLPRWHDVVLARIENDRAQWAYMTRLPRKWADDFMQSISVGSKRQNHLLKTTSMKTSESRFHDFLDILFLTKKERERHDISD